MNFHGIIMAGPIEFDFDVSDAEINRALSESKNIGRKVGDIIEDLADEHVHRIRSGVEDLKNVVDFESYGFEYHNFNASDYNQEV